jgi:hypothetical protein
MATKTKLNNEEAAAAFQAKKITLQEYTAIVTANAAGASNRERSVKLNKGGGLYIYDPAMGAGLNLSPIGAVRALVNEPTLLEQIRSYLSEGNASQREKDQREAVERAAEREAKKASKRK